MKGFAEPLIPTKEKIMNTTLPIEDLVTAFADLNPFIDYVAMSDRGAMYRNIRRSTVGVIAKSDTTGQIVRVVRTGRGARNNVVRVRIEFAQDLGGPELVFNRNHAVGGYVNEALLDVL